MRWQQYSEGVYLKVMLGSFVIMKDKISDEIYVLQGSTIKEQVGNQQTEAEVEVRI